MDVKPTEELILYVLKNAQLQLGGKFSIVIQRYDRTTLPWLLHCYKGITAISIDKEVPLTKTVSFGGLLAIHPVYVGHGVAIFTFKGVNTATERGF